MAAMTSRRQDRGAALVICTLFIALLLVSLGAVSLRLTSQSRQVGHHEDAVRCRWALEAAVTASLARHSNGASACVGVDGWEADVQGSLRLPCFEDEGVAPLRLGTAPPVACYSLFLDWSNDGLDNNGDGQIDDPNEEGYCSIHAFARCRASTQGLEVTLRSAAGSGLTQVARREIPYPGGGTSEGEAARGTL